MHEIGDYAEGCPLCSKAGYPVSVAPVYSPLPPLRVRLAPDTGCSAFAHRLPYSTFHSLGEGNTPIAPLDQAAKELDLQSVTIKLEASNPTGSHKDRMTAQFVARAVAKNAPVVAAASSGNAGVSLAAYAAASSLRCVIVTTSKISPAWRRAIEMAGADMHYVDDPLERWAFIRTKAREDGWLSATNVLNPPTGSEPFGVDGYKTVAYELASDPRTAHADTIVVPTARGDLLWGIYAGYKELVEERAIKQMPRLVAVEPFPRLELALAGTDWRGRVYRNVAAGVDQRIDPGLSSRGGDRALLRPRRFRRSRLGHSRPATLARAGFYLELSAAASLTGLRLASTRIAIQNAVLIATSHGYKEVSEAA